MVSRMIIPLGTPPTVDLPILGWESLGEFNRPLPNLETPPFAAPDLMVWRPGLNTWDLKLPDGSSYNNPVGGATAKITTGSGGVPGGPHSIISDPNGYWKWAYGNNDNYAAGQLPDTSLDKIYILWRIRYVTNAITKNTKTLRLYGRGAIGIPQNSDENYEGLYMQNGGGGPIIYWNDRTASQGTMLGLWQKVPGTGGDMPNGDDGQWNVYASNLIDTGYHNLLWNYEIKGGPGGVPRSRFWWDGTPMIQLAGNGYNRSGFRETAGNTVVGPYTWNTPPVSDPDYADPPSWCDAPAANPDPTPTVGSFRYFDTHHDGNITPGEINCEGWEMSRVAIDPNRVMFS